MKYWYLLLVFLVLSSCTEKGDEVAVLRTNMGTIVIAFYDGVPRHTENFKKLCREGFYDETGFHRVIPEFMIQGGDPNTKDEDRTNDGTGGPGYTIEEEIRYPHLRGTIASARLPDAENPNQESNGSQFYICTLPQPHLDAGHTVFGYVIEGLEIVDRISFVKRDREDNPVQRVLIRSASIERRAVTTE